MGSAKASRVLVNVLTALNVGFAVAVIIAGIVQLVQGNSIGWLLILFAPVVLLLGYVRVSQLRERQERRSRSE
ncbi:hypothetical protein B7R21_17700 [Subtercola boreus]|uniref:Uncharacterized protein n=1 Tax=Subtercola boreus TaxID=120213 RepID=A0A3E0VBR7_9MICO|nr:hypothetical protein [Subtercola boreus]RFA06948.1 hypothetical protein B7R21_17700 [Subtercola boreus]